MVDPAGIAVLPPTLTGCASVAIKVWPDWLVLELNAWPTVTVRRGRRVGLNRGLIVDAGLSGLVFGDLLNLLLSRRGLDCASQLNFALSGCHVDLGILCVGINGDLVLNVFHHSVVTWFLGARDRKPKQHSQNNE
jgi:hypothetical protein